MLLCLRMVLLYGQNYPVQVSLQLAPPYTPQLSALYTDPGRMGITLLNKDLATPLLSVYLQLKLEGPGITLQTRAGYRSPASVLLTAGVPQMLGGAEIADLLQPANLDFQGLDRNRFLQAGQLLPEGLWRFSVTAFSTDRALQVSNTGSISLGLFKHKPPLLNFPVDGARSGSQLPQYVLFQWTPRHYASPFAAGSIRYRLRLVELVPNNRNPNEAMQSTLLPLFETITEQTSYAYGPADPPLFPGRGYAWQVQALDVDGSDLFEQDGYSQVNSFVFGDACGMPQAFSLQADAGRSFTARWRGSTTEASNAAYLLWYRQVGMPVWQTVMVADTMASVGGLLPNTTYEARVTRLCLGGESAPTGTLTITTTQEQGAWDAKSKSCGKPAPQFDLSNRKPLAALNAGGSFTAADFTIKVLSAQGQNGEFSGSGLVLLPFTGKVPIPCTWEAVSINADRRLISGSIRILQQPLVLSNLNLEKLSDRWRDLFGSNWNRTAYKRMDAAVLGVENTGDGRIRIRTATGEETVFGGKNTVITDPAGKRWYVSAGGKITGPEGPAEKPIVADDARGEGMPGSVLPDGSMVLFGPSQNNALAWDEYSIRNQTGGSTYDRMDGPPGGYMPGWKLLATGASEGITATLRKGKVKLHPDSTRFLRSDGVRVKSERINDSTWRLQVPGRLHLWSDAVWAVGSIVPKDSGQATGRRILGKVNLIAVDGRKVHVLLVPVGNTGGGVSASEIQKSIQPLLDRMGVQATVQVASALQVGGYDAAKDKIAVNRRLLNTAYGPELQRFVKAWEAKSRYPGRDTAVVFLTGPAADDTKGYMGLNNPYGFVFCGSSKPDAHTLAHELGHGLLVLEHPFGEDEGKAKSTLNLMDYSAPHGQSHFVQWKRIHDKEEVGNYLWGLRQKEEEGKYVQFRYVINDELPGKKEEILANGFLDPGGRVIEKIIYTAGGKDVFVSRVLDNKYPFIVFGLKVYRKNGNDYTLIEEHKAEFDSAGVFQKYSGFTGTLQYRVGRLTVPVYIIKSSCFYKVQKVSFLATERSRKYNEIRGLVDPLIQEQNWRPELFLLADPACYNQFKKELINSNNCKDDALIKIETKKLSSAIDSINSSTENNLVNLVLNSCQSSLSALPWYKLRKGLHFLLNSAVSRNKQMAILSMLSAGLMDNAGRLDSLFKSGDYVLTKKAFQQFDPDLLCGKTDAYRGFLGTIGATHVANFVNTHPEFIIGYYDELDQDAKVLFTAGLSVALEPTWDANTDLKEVYVYDISTSDLPEGIEKHTAGCVQFINNKFRIGYSSVCYSLSPAGYLPCSDAINNRFDKVNYVHDFTKNCDSVVAFKPADPTATSFGDGLMVLPAVLSGKMIIDKIDDTNWEVFKFNISLAMPTMLRSSGSLKFNKLPKASGGLALLTKQKQRLQNLKTKYGNLDFNDFRPDGKTINDITTSMYNEMFADLASKPGWTAQQKVNRIKELLESGSTIPQKITNQKGTELFKFVKKGAKPSDVTEYWFTKTELDDLVAKGRNMESKSGLPLGSMAEEYDIYKITANKPAPTYISKIAPTNQRGYATTGGSIQTLVLDRSLWSSPVKYNKVSFIPDF